MIYFPIRGVPKGRPRATGRGRFIQMYTPKKTKDFEDKVSNLARQLFKEPKEGFLFMEVEFGFKPNKSLSKKKQESLIDTYFDHKTTDIDNLLKSFLDGLNGIAYIDDSQIVEIKAKKVYSDENYIRFRYGEIKTGKEL